MTVRIVPPPPPHAPLQRGTIRVKATPFWQLPFGLAIRDIRRFLSACCQQLLLLGVVFAAAVGVDVDVGFGCAVALDIFHHFVLLSNFAVELAEISEAPHI